MVASSPIPIPVNATAAQALPTSAAPEDVTLLPVQIAELPDKLSSLTRSVQLAGPVVDIQDNGTFALQTVVGNLELNLPQPIGNDGKGLLAQLNGFLQNQRPVGVVIQPGSPPIAAMLMLPTTERQTVKPESVDGDIPQPFADAVAVKQAKGIGIAAGQTLKVIVLPEHTGKEFLVVPPKSTSGAGEKSQQANRLQNPQESKSPHPPSTPQQTKTIPAQSLVVAASLAKSMGTEINVRVKAVAPADSAIHQNGSADEVVAKIVGKGANGQLIMNAGGVALFVRHGGGDAPTGSRVLLTLLPMSPETVAATAKTDEHGAGALRRIIAELNNLDPQLAQQVMRDRVPQPNDGLAGTLLFFMNSMRQSGAAGWLGGDSVDRLERNGKRELVSKLIETLENAGGTAQDSTVGSWRTYPLPLHAMGDFQTLHLHVHQDKPESRPGENRPAESKTRFLISLNMTRLGAMQLDGLSQRKRLDMVVRSERQLPDGLPNELRGLYARTLEAVGFAGTLTFQIGRQSWLVVKPDNVGTVGVMT